MHNSSMTNAAVLLGRVLLAAIFIISGWEKISDYATTAAYMSQAGVPGGAAAAGHHRRAAGRLVDRHRLAEPNSPRVALAGFSLLAAYFFHFDFGNQEQAIQFMKNVAIAGGFLVLAGSGPGAWSVDGRNTA